MHGPLSATSTTDPGTQVLENFLQAWTHAIARRDAQAIAALFDEHVLFTATAPEPLQGRSQVRAYYETAPAGLLAHVWNARAVMPRPDLVHGVTEVRFEAAGGIALQGRLGLSLVLRAQGWLVSAYQLSIQAAPAARARAGDDAND